MIKKIHLKKFKQFRDQVIPLEEKSVFLIAGVNNSGKSTILHALAVWEFCRTLIEAEKGCGTFLRGSTAQGLGLGDDEFSPILVPSLAHLWTNLKTQKSSQDQDGFTLRIKCFWDSEHGIDKELEFGLALANDRLFVKTTHSNLEDQDPIPRIAYLPPFAGITDKETRLPIAIRRRMIGQGLSGAVLRNVLLDLFAANQTKRAELRGTKTKISDRDLRSLRNSDPWEILQRVLRNTFGSELIVQPFREEYHSYIKVQVVRGEVSGYKLTRFPGYKSRDIMVEGSGFLQWLSVYALATDPSIDTLLLDEPDAHLHSSLQAHMLDKLKEISGINSKQVLIATHSSELLRHSPPESILQVGGNKSPKFLKSETHKVGLLAGLGSDYSPRIEKARRTKRILFVEGEFDARILEQTASAMNKTWPDEWVIWKNAQGHKERRHIFDALSEEIDGLVALSLRDRDDEALNSVGEQLEDRSFADQPQNFLCRKWRRRHIESYLIWPPAMAAASQLPEDEIRNRIENEYAIAINDTFINSNAPDALLDLRGKDVLAWLCINPNDVIEHIADVDLAEDLKTMVDELIAKRE